MFKSKIGKIFFIVMFLVITSSVLGCQIKLNGPGTNDVTEQEDFELTTTKIYNLAVESGYEGTYQEWLNSIKGDSILLEVRNGNIEWKYITNEEWKVLVSLSELVGEQGPKGEKVLMQVADGYIQFKYESDTEWANLVSLSSLRGETGEDGKEVLMQVAEGYIQWKYENEENWKNLCELSSLVGPKGDSGKEVTLNVVDDYICWQYVGDATWTKLIQISTLIGPTGENGKNVELRVEDNYIQWSIEGQKQWTNLVNLNDLKGPQGETGLSAYEIFLKYYPSYKGSEAEWIYDVATGNICNLFGHDFNEEKVKPTCTTKGYSKFTCKVCNYSYEGNEVELIEHNIIDNTCTMCGYCNVLETAQYVTTSDGWVVACANGKAYLTTYVGDGEKMFFPSTYNSIPLSFEYFSFDYNQVADSLQYLWICDSYECEIKPYQFHGFKKLKVVVLGDKVTSIGTEAFGLCSNLEAVTIGKGVKYIGTFPFDQAFKLELINYNATRVEKIEANSNAPFEFCGRDSKGITLNIGANVEVIPNYLFSSWPVMPESAPNITKVVIPQNSVLEEIGYESFRDCANITEIFLPSSLKTIKTSAFHGTGLMKIYYQGTSEEYELIDLYGSNSVLHEAKVYFYSETEPLDPKNYWKYENNDIVLWEDIVYYN